MKYNIRFLFQMSIGKIKTKGIANQDSHLTLDRLRVLG